jgi:LytS/YehU family sensor histidine kinase
MLLQPFVENAVKHGMAQLKNGGEIVVGFTKDGKNLIITITDNGKGFDASKNYNGLGLKLSKKRIALLNDVYKECPITLQIDSAPSNTAIRLILAHWL